MGRIYSAELGEINTNVAGSTVLYTVPAGPDVVVLRDVFLLVQAGGHSLVQVHRNAVVTTILARDNTTGSTFTVDHLECRVVLMAGDTVAVYLYAAETTQTLLSGYVFTS